MIGNSDKNISRPSNLPNFKVVAGEDFYQQLHNLSNTIISIQYNPDERLNFRIKEIQHGKIVDDDVKGIGLRCWINKRIYLLKREHLDQMSNRECRELFNHLGIDGSKIFGD